MGALNNFHAARQEILRQASVALGNRPVTLWEVTAAARLEPRASTEPGALQRPADIDVYSTLERWRVAPAAGSRWLGTRVWADGPWVIAPVRTHAPAPPPDGLERRSRERLTLELTGLCLGLGERRGAGPAAAHVGDERSGARGGHPEGRDNGELANLPAMIAHEASNPLASARAGLQFATESVRRWQDLPDERRRPLLDELGLVRNDIDRAVTFLRAVQDRARQSAGEQGGAAERFDVVRVVRSCMALESRLLRDQGMPLELETALESVYINGDPAALFDLLVNLIRNAADACARRPAPVEIQLDQDDEALRLSVRDRGVGIPAEHLGRIFDPGFTTKEFGKGSGLGLARVRQVAEEVFGGGVSVQSSVGAGTVFTVRLPIPPQRGRPSSVLSPPTSVEAR
ncbi:MAG: sensor histidine kinase [Gemmatimonadales bacterium]